MSRRKTYGFTREKAERISKNTEEAYLRLYEKVSISKEQLKDLGEQSLKAYTETKPEDFSDGDFLTLEENTDFLDAELKVDENGDQFYVWALPETDYILTLKVPVQEENVMEQ